MQGDSDRCLDAGMDHYITKPVDARLLFRLLSSLAPRTTTRGV